MFHRVVAAIGALIVSGCLDKGNPLWAGDSGGATDSDPGASSTTLASGGSTSSSPTSVSASAASDSGTSGGTTTTAGTAGSADTSGSSGSTATTAEGSTGAACASVDSPDDTEAAAQTADLVSCGDAQQVANTAVLEDLGDVDWRRFDVEGPCPDGGRPLIALGAPGGEAICAYLECTGGGAGPPTVICDEGVDSTSPDLRVGCCGVGGLQIDVDCNPPGEIHEMRVWFSIEGPSAACQSYVVNYEVSKVPDSG